MSLLAFFGWLGDTPWSVDLHESQYAYAIIESIHVWTMAVFFGLVVMFDLRLLGVIMRKVPVSEVLERLLPWTIAGFVLMVITGLLLFYAIPVRSFQNLFFRGKMILMVLAGLNVWLFHSRVYPRVVARDGDRFRLDGGEPERLPARHRSSGASGHDAMVLDNADFHYA